MKQSINNFFNKDIPLLPLYRLVGLDDELGIKIGNVLFCFSFILAFAIQMSWFMVLPDVIQSIWPTIHATALFMLTILIKIVFFQRYRIKDILIIVVVLAIFTNANFVVDGYDQHWDYIQYCIPFIIGAQNINFRRHFFIILCMLSSTWILSFIYGHITNLWISDSYIYRGRISYVVGGLGSNEMGRVFFCIYSLLVYLSKGKIKWYHRVIAVAMILYDYIVVNCYTSIGCILLLTISCELFEYFTKRNVLERNSIKDTPHNNRYAKYCDMFADLVTWSGIGIILVFFIFSYIDISPVFPEDGLVYSITSNRLHSCHATLSLYSPWTLWGQEWDRDLVSQLSGNAFVDSIPTKYLVVHGVLWTIVFLGSLFALVIRLKKEKIYYCMSIIAIYCLYSAYEHNVTRFVVLPYLVLLVCFIGDRRSLKECIDPINVSKSQ